jgi:hypothetical protein
MYLFCPSRGVASADVELGKSETPWGLAVHGAAAVGSGTAGSSRYEEEASEPLDQSRMTRIWRRYTTLFIRPGPLDVRWSVRSKSVNWWGNFNMNRRSLMNARD